jgi:hypothetical protein
MDNIKYTPQERLTELQELYNGMEYEQDTDLNRMKIKSYLDEIDYILKSYTELNNTIQLKYYGDMNIFNFKEGDVIEFCDEHYFVIKNYGSKGLVKPFAENYYINSFYWKFEDSIAKFVRRATEEEMKQLGI